MDGLEGRTAVVTGAASGIGLGMTEAFANRGMRVLMADIERDVLESEAERLQRSNLEVRPFVTDVSALSGVEAMLTAANESYGPVHVLCNNAGVGGGAPGGIWEASDKDWRWVMGVNFDGVLNGLRTFVPHMLAHAEPSHIVNTSSIAGMMTGTGSIYGVSKHAVSRLTEGLYFDLKNREANIGVTLLCPGIIDTNIIGSGRNRPADLVDHDRPANAPSEASERFARYFKEKGMAPRDVGEMVADAICDGRFYLFTQDEFMPSIKQRFDDILAMHEPRQPKLPD